MSDVVIKAGVLGHPIAHSLSPVIHGRWLDAHGIDGTYEAIDPGPDEADFRRCLDHLRAEGWAGCNVTLPFKAAALAAADEVSLSDRKLGVVNTLVFKPGGGIRAWNTDVSGFAGALTSRLNERRRAGGYRALVLGAGGTAPAVLAALGSGPDVTIANRTRETAERLASAFGAKTVAWDDRDDALSAADVVVNATSLGLAGQPSPDVDLARLAPSAIVADCVYAPGGTDLIRRAKALGLEAFDGMEMLVRQAVPGFHAWFTPMTAIGEDEMRRTEAHLRALT